MWYRVKKQMVDESKQKFCWSMCAGTWKCARYVLVHNVLWKGFVAFDALSTMKCDCCHGKMFFKLCSGRANSCFQLPVIATSQLLSYLCSHHLCSFLFSPWVSFKGMHCIQSRSFPFTKVVLISQGHVSSKTKIKLKYR